MKNNHSIISRSNIILILVILVMLYLLTCNRKPSSELNPVIPVKEQKEKVVIDSIASKKYNDSVALIIKQKGKEAEMWYNEWVASEGRYNDLEKGTVELITQEVPDTCKAMQEKYNKQFIKLSKENKQKDISCENTINAQKGVITEQKVLINKGNSIATSLRARLDTAFEQQRKLSKAVSSLKPKNSIYIGVTALGNESKFVQGYGINLGLRNKKGNMYEAGALQIGSTISYTISFKKTLFKF